MRKEAKNKGFALLLVLLLMAAGVTLASSYLSAASVRSRLAATYAQASRARYVAESGLQHALCLMRDASLQLPESGSLALGSFTLEQGASDTYTITVTPTGVEKQYILTADAVVNGIKRTSRMTVCRTTTASTFQETMIVGSGPMTVPGGVTINGDIHLNSGRLTNYGTINGTATSVGGITDNGYIQNNPGGATVKTVPVFNVADYYNYTLSSGAGTAVQFTDTTMKYSNCPGNAITPTNPAGVIKCPAGLVIANESNGKIQVTGTIVVEGDMTIDGHEFSVTPLPGFPAIICTGTLYISDNARDVVINGAVAAANGIMSGRKSTHSNTIINGPVICQTRGMTSGLNGTHVINYDAARGSLYDMSTPKPDQGTVVVQQWSD